MNFFGRKAVPDAKPRVSDAEVNGQLASLEAGVDRLEKKERHLDARIVKMENDVRKLMTDKPPQKERAMREMQLIKSLRKQRTANSHMITRARLTVNAINVARDQILELDSMKDRTKLFKTITGGRDIAGEMEDAIADDDEMLADADEMMDTMIGSGLPAGMDEEELEADLATIMAGGEEVPGAVATPPATTATPMPGIPAMPGLPAATTTPAMPIAPTAAATAAPASAEADFAGLEDLMG